ncbi:hypothetical protein ACFYTQ_12440 [Nocardia sp. NPDC004068]|uniref:baeRF11 domain-containing protein n=1 Tax=Nocardia sp. NPDC004068 TaxID=3364303 RepID=UPI0036774365
MLHTDVPTRREIEELAAATGAPSVSIYTPTEPATDDPDKARIEFSNQVREALGHVDGRDGRTALEEEFDDLIEDDDFWRYQSRTLVVHATPERLRTYRVPNRLRASVTVGDRFLVKPLLRATSFPQAAFVLALSEGAVRLVEINADRPAEQVRLPEMPTSAADHARKASLSGRAPKRRLQGTEGRKVLVRQYARAIDHELRAVLAGRDLPLILAATEPIDSLYRSVNSYPGLLAESIPGNPEELADEELAALARPLLDRYYAERVADVRERFEQGRSDGRALSDVSDVARAATFGSVDTLLVDIDAIVPGSVDPASGEVTFADEDEVEAPGVTDEIARRVLANSGTVLAVRADDLPDGGPVAAILRYVV